MPLGHRGSRAHAPRLRGGERKPGRRILDTKSLLHSEHPLEVAHAIVERVQPRSHEHGQYLA